MTHYLWGTSLVMFESYLPTPEIRRLVLTLLMGFALVYSIMPHVIAIAVSKGLVARAVARSSHKGVTPLVGGIPLFLGVIFTTLLLTPPGGWSNLQYILGALVIVFMVGTKDDVEQLSPRSKMVGLLIAIAIVVIRGGVQLECMYGLLGFTGPFPLVLSWVVSAFTLLVITNALNLIDGINGLAGSVGCIAMVTFGVWFFLVGIPHYSILALATAGGLLAFLHFNITPARTFMGDTGSLFVGLLSGILTIEFIDLNYFGDVAPAYAFNQPVAVAVAVLIIPLFDTIRVFVTRVLRGYSPFKPDRRHIHHLLIDTGYSHLAATSVLALFNLSLLSIVMALDAWLGLHWLIGLQLAVCLLLVYPLHRRAVRARNAAAAAAATPAPALPQGA